MEQRKGRKISWGILVWLGLYLSICQPVFGADASYKTAYRVKMGDTFQSIGSRYGVSWELIAAMNNIAAPYDLKPGQQIHIPRDPQTEIVIAKGDTLWDISRKHQVDLGTLMVYNGLYAGEMLDVGQVLYVPNSGGQGEPVITASAQAVASRSAAAISRPIMRKTPAKGRSDTRSPAKGAWHLPIQGTITSEYGKRRSGGHHGIDLAAAAGTTIRAAKDGRVLHSGWYNSIYGNAVIIDHGNGEKTLYAHCSKTTAKEGAKVAAGAPIAKVGSTGRSTGPHVHFEIYIDGRTVNPRTYVKF